MLQQRLDFQAKALEAHTAATEKASAVALEVAKLQAATVSNAVNAAAGNAGNCQLC
jgi:hypothetical protein